MRIKFHGTRGSRPTSVSAERVEEIARNVFEFARSKKFTSWRQVKAALKQKPRAFHQTYSCATTCLEVKSTRAPMPLFFDAGTGIQNAAVDPRSALNHTDFRLGRGKLALFLSHTHWDHIIGLPFVDQLYRVGNQFHVYGVHKKLRERIETLFGEEHFPVPFRIVEKNLSFNQIALGKDINFGGLKISHAPQVHPGGSFAYRVQEGRRSFVFATDVELGKSEAERSYSNVYANADLLVLDAHFSPEEYINREGYGHSHIHIAVDFAVEHDVKHLALFHQSPDYNDQSIEQQLDRARTYLKQRHGKKHPLQISMAFDGEEIRVG